jgi:uncharacterized protein YukE
MASDQLNYPADLPDVMDRVLRASAANHADAVDLRQTVKQLTGTSVGATFTGFDQCIDQYDREYSSCVEQDTRLAKAAREAHQNMMAVDQMIASRYNQTI